PLSLFAASLKEQRSSKSLTVPLVHIRKVFPLAGFSAVVWPVIAPSCTDHSLGLPSQPDKSMPLNSLIKPLSPAWPCNKGRWPGSAARATEVCRNKKALAMSAHENFWFICVTQTRIMKLTSPLRKRSRHAAELVKSTAPTSSKVNV